MSRRKKARSETRMPLKLFIFFITVAIALFLGLFIYTNSIGDSVKDKGSKRFSLMWKKVQVPHQ